MEKIYSYEQYSRVLAEFKEGRERCATNQLMTREELEGHIEKGRFFYEKCGETLWFLEKERFFTSASFYVPKDVPIQARKLNKETRVVLTGNETRYNEEWEQQLLREGFQKREKYMEFICQLGEHIDAIENQRKVLKAFCERHGFYCRKAVKADYPEICTMLEKRFDQHKYMIRFLMTDAEVEQMEHSGTWVVICDRDGKVCAVCAYEKKNRVAMGLHVASHYQGLGAFAMYEMLAVAHQNGCVKFDGWIRSDNTDSLRMNAHILEPTGKYQWLFILNAEEV